MEEITERTEQKTPPKHVWIKVLAVALAVLIPSATLVQAVSVRFSEKDYTGTLLEQAAALTGSSTGYLQQGELARMGVLLKTMIGSPKTYEEFDAFASVAIARTDYASAITYMQGCIDTFAGSFFDKAMLYLKLGSLHALTGDYAGAIQCFDEAEALNPNVPDTYLLRAQMYSLLGQAEAALLDIERYNAKAGEQPSIQAAVAPLYESAGQYEKAVEYYTLSIDTPDYYQASSLLGRARCRMLLGELPAAGEDLTRYLTEGGEDTEGQASAMLGVCRMSEAKYREAITLFQKALAAGYPQKALIYSQSVLCSYIIGDYEAVIADGETAVALLKAGETPEGKPSELTGATVDLAQLYQWIALAKLAKEDYRGSLEAFGLAASQDATLSDLDYYRGVCHTALGEYPQAITFFTASIQKEEMLSLCYYNRGLCELQSGDYKTSLLDLLTVIERNDDADAVAGANELLTLFTVESTEEPGA